MKQFSVSVSISFNCFFIFSLLCLLFVVSQAQQTYLSNKQLDCYNYKNLTSTNGYVCNGPQTSCLSYLTFRSQPPYYDSPSSIGYLLGSEPSAIARINKISDVEKIPPNTQIIVPLNCSCTSSSFYQHDSSYTLKTRSETYFSVANNTYQGLTTCQALMKQNPSYDSRNLSIGLRLLVPLRCACPSRNQTASGVRFLLSYLVTWGDSISSIAARFHVDTQTLFIANDLSPTDLIFPFTPILVPLKTEPGKIQTGIPPPPPPKSPPLPLQSNPSAESSKKNKWVFVGIGTGIGVVSFILAIFGFLLWFMRRRRHKGIQATDKLSNGIHIQENKSTGSISSQDGTVGQHLIGSLNVYKFEELQRATHNFGEDHRIKGSVYGGVIRGDKAAIKRKRINNELDSSYSSSISRNSISSTESEINILKQINHSSIIRLSGFCVREEEGNTYLVYEFAENGSLSDWLHEDDHKKKYSTSISGLGWKQRVQIACDVADGLNYLHNYTNPPYIHKDLKSSNILLTGEFRAKMTNFGMAMPARTVEEDLKLTRHVVGTRGYMAPEYLEHGLVSPKLDVFAFGVVMLELISGREAAANADASQEGEGDLLLSASVKQVLEGENVRENLKGFVDPSLRSHYPLDSAFSMAHLALNCVTQDLNSRPTMSHVFMSLSKILSSSLDWDPSSDELEYSKSLSHGR